VNWVLIVISMTGIEGGLGGARLVTASPEDCIDARELKRFPRLHVGAWRYPGVNDSRHWPFLESSTFSSPPDPGINPGENVRGVSSLKCVTLTKVRAQFVWRAGKKLSSGASCELGADRHQHDGD